MNVELDEEFLKKIVGTPRVTGYEFPAQKLIREHLEPKVHDVRVDPLGNLISVLNPDGEPRILLEGHIDQIGLQISGFHETGVLHFKPLGMIDPCTLPGKRVNIWTGEGEKHLGVIGRKSVRAFEKPKREEPLELENLYIDVGAGDKDEAKEMISVGDFATFAEYEYRRMGENKVAVGAGFDDSIGAFIVTEVMREISKAKDTTLDAAVFGLSGVQEEIGGRGVRAAGFSINPDIALVTDVTFTSDVPGIKSRKAGEVKLGGGPVLGKGPKLNPKLRRRIEGIAEKKEISIQPLSKGTPLDASFIQVARGGVATALVSVPNRHMHTASEVVCLDDVRDIVELFTSFVKTVSDKDYFLPF